MHCYSALDPAVIAHGFADNGQDVPTVGETVLLKKSDMFDAQLLLHRTSSFFDFDQQLHQLLQNCESACYQRSSSCQWIVQPSADGYHSS